MKRSSISGVLSSASAYRDDLEIGRVVAQLFERVGFNGAHGFPQRVVEGACVAHGHVGIS